MGLFNKSIQIQTLLHAFQDKTLGRCAKPGRYIGKNDNRLLPRQAEWMAIHYAGELRQ
jgi:hypothetical protein